MKIGLRASFSRVNHASLKIKLISGFVLIILLMGSISLITFFMMKSTVAKFDAMIETTVLANKIKSITDETPLVTANYIMDHSDVNEELLKKNLGSLDLNINLLKVNIQNDEGKIKVNSLISLKSSVEDKIKLIYKSMEEKKRVTETLNIKDEMGKISVFIKNELDALINNELVYDVTTKKQLNNEVAKITIITIACIAAIAFLSILGAVVFSSSIAKTISTLAKYSQRIADGDLTIKTLNIKSRDELYILAGSFKKMTENLRSLIENIGGSSEKVATSVDMLKLSTEQSSKAIEQVAYSISDVSNGASDQSQQSLNTSNAINKIFESNKKAYENANTALKSSDIATDAAIKGSKKVRDVLKQIEIIEEKIVATQQVTETFKVSSEKIEVILGTLSTIAVQTKILALNAAIEAARAGNAGKGFGVVAGEVRKLAEESSNATKYITDLLKGIQLDSQKVNKSMKDGVEEIKTGIILANEADTAFNEIVCTSKDVDMQIKAINLEVEKMKVEITNVDHMSKDISEIAQKTAEKSEGVAAVMEEQTASMQEIYASTYLLHEMVGELRQLVQKFEI